VDETQALAKPFEESRPHLRAVAYRMLGSRSEAEDAVQEAWLRLQRAGADEVANLRGWLTTVVARVCLDMLRSRKARSEQALGDASPRPAAAIDEVSDPERDLALADSVGVALLVVLEALDPAERVAFVLHDLFAVPFEDIAPVVGRTTEATRQLASRGRRRVQGADPTTPPDRAKQRQVVEAFLAASRKGDFEALLAVLDPGVVMHADQAALNAASRAGKGALSIAPQIRGAREVATTFLGKAAAAKAALVGGELGAVWAPGGTPRAAFRMTIVDGRIAAIELVADPTRMAELELRIFDD
jgi:RNA polymerase sigma-70 factor (ECF subfamily)